MSYGHYRTLGIKPSATLQEVKKAYRALAMQYHPDKNPENRYAEARFLEIQEAYSVLSNAAARKQYDDNLWLSGMGKAKYTQTVTAGWLLDISQKLVLSLEKMDTYRMSHSALQEYILLILTDAHIGVLQQQHDEAINAAIVANILKAAQRLDNRYMPEIITRLHIIASGNDLKATVQEYEHSRNRQALQEKLFPYIIIIITLALCMLMYLYGGK